MASAADLDSARGGGDRRPPVTVVVPTYRRPRSIRGCVEALANLEYPQDRLEVVVVDDGGGLDPTVLKREALQVRVRVVSQENRGPASARNLGARAGEGAVVAFTDDDCRPRPDWLAHIVDALVAEPSVLVGGRVVNALPGNLCSQASQDLVSFLYDYFPRARALLPFFTSNNIACRRDAFLEVGGFDETFRFSAAEDRDFSERWAGAIGALRLRPDAVVDHYHDLTFYRFLRQHHFYGRGAAHLARRRRKRGQDAPRPEPLAFYARMLAYPVRTRGGWRGPVLASLLSLSQVAGLTGMAVELLHPSYRGD